MSCIATFFTTIAGTLTPPPTPGDLADLQFNLNNLTTAYQANESDFDISSQLEKEVENLIDDELDRRFAERFYIKAAAAFVVTLIYCVVITIAISQGSVLVVFLVSVVVTMAFFILVLLLLSRKDDVFSINTNKIERDVAVYESLKQNQLTYGVCAY